MYIIFYLNCIIIQIGNNINPQTQRNKKNDIQKQKAKGTSSITKINESYNADKAGDIITKEYDPSNNKIDNKNYFQEIQSDNSSISNINKVRINFKIKII